MRRMFWRGLLAVGGIGLWRLLRRREPVDLRGKVVIITGASSGIGRAAAHAFATAGAHVVLAARRADMLRNLAHELAVYGVRALAVPTDVRRDEDLHRLVSATLDAFGRIDVLVNNAGLSYGGPLPELPPDRVRALLEVNLYGPLRLAQLVLPVMLRQEADASGLAGHIVNVSSMAGQIPAPGMTVYAATRIGLTRFSDALRREVDRTGVRVSSVFPTWTRTPMADGVPESGLRASRTLLPAERFDEPEVPAAAIVDAVRFNRRAVPLGGLQMRAGYLGRRLAPGLVDLWWRLVVDIPAYIEAVRGLGA
jgi:NAD(P)-dependent dehydrogenase (short-subunit alcohol dehydrogenase family)